MRDAPLVLVAAVARNGIIGAKGGLPGWLLERLETLQGADLGKPLVVGKKTFELIGRALPGVKRS